MGYNTQIVAIQREFSAGGVVYKKQNNQLYWLVAQHSQHKGWVFPKGLIGDHKKGETSKDTAVREVEEETGVKAKIITKLQNPVKYFYVWKGEKRLKTVTYFLMEYESGDIDKHDMEMSAVEWLPTSQVEERLTYKSDKESFRDALEMMKTISL